ncbi:g1805 [Coccomyxa viridis]|uniref:G1805 protein n=1 Tax=Coccomyxa viridis TaxID=1274662 RepID=A0ABP1FQS2_9CHLO
MVKKKKAVFAGDPQGQKTAVKQDPLAYLGENVMAIILGSLGADDCARCTLVCKLWRNLAASDELWMRQCMGLIRDTSHAKVSLLRPKEFEPMQPCIEWYSYHMQQKERSQITKEDLCGHCWKFRFKRQAGEFWLSWDPYWTKSGPQMQRVFHEDGSVLGMPSHEPFWFQDSECRWRFTKSREGKRGGPFVKVNHWPSLVVSRQDGFGWRMENCWVIYESIDPEADEAAAMLRVWDSCQKRRGPLTLDLEAWIK